jgi:hypothetical protein
MPRAKEVAKRLIDALPDLPTRDIMYALYVK